MLQAFAPQPTDVVCEIGPGEGVLTRALIGRVARLHAVELDRDLVALLQQRLPADQITIHSADALKFDFRALLAPGERLRLIGNLPYNISTPLLFHLFDQLEDQPEAASSPSPARGPRPGPISDMLFMLQKEVVDRLAASPGSKDYGRLSVMIQWRLAVTRCFDVPPGAFSPPPRVDSSVVRLIPHAQPPVGVRDPTRFAQVVRAAFAQRRKTLRNSLHGVVDAAHMESVGIDPQRRAETLTLQEFGRLANLDTGD